MSKPLVSVICLCYNHKRFVEASLYSVINQTYPFIQIIVVDDASTDGSKAVIEKIIADHPAIIFINLPKNVGNCKAFNQGLKQAKGQYIVDLATDDLFLPTRIEKQVEFFDNLDDSYGIVHTNAIHIDENNLALRDHTGYLIKKGLIKTIPQGDVYEKIIQRYFVSAPSMLVKKEVFDELGGYDEALTYEDFDFWVRSARHWKYAYLDEPLTMVRKVTNSKSSGWYKRGNKQLHSTYLICKKIQKLNQSKQEDEAIVNRLKFEVRQSVFSNNYKEAKLFFKLLAEYKGASLKYKFLLVLARLGLPLAPFRKLYHHIRFN